ncbi:MAG: TRAP transporter small permease [Candidatus Accumulibacter sp.]|jgi:TRAP-type C4-dicarboxylate transport system permease small subunit|nr:TRAP transporter small permease [Accumulibacter sp.]
MKSCDKIIGQLAGAAGMAASVGIFFLMIFIVLDVFLRFTFNSPIMGSYELVERGMFCAIFASFAYAQTEKAHIRIDFLVGKLPEKPHLFFDFFFGILSTGTAAVIAYAAVLQAQTAFASHYTTSVLRLSLYPFYWVEFVCMLVFAITLLYDSVKNAIAIFNPRVAREVKAGWSVSSENTRN